MLWVILGHGPRVKYGPINMSTQLILRIIFWINKKNRKANAKAMDIILRIICLVFYIISKLMVGYLILISYTRIKTLTNVILKNLFNDCT